MSGVTPTPSGGLEVAPGVTVHFVKCVCGHAWTVDPAVEDPFKCPKCWRAMKVTVDSAREKTGLTDQSAQAQAAADARAAARADIDEIVTVLANAEAFVAGDKPEGMKTLTISVTLAHQWAESLRRARRYL